MPTPGSSTAPRSRRRPLLLLLLLLPLLAGCTEKVDWEVSQRQSSTPAGDLYGSHTVGQTFAPQHGGLSSIEVLLVDHGAESGRPNVPLELKLCRDLLCQEEVARTTIPAEAIAHNLSYRFRFPRQGDSAGRTYVLWVAAPQAATPARATLWAHSTDLYPDGTLLLDGQTAAGDLSFWTYYDADAGSLTGELLRGAGRGLRYLPSLLLLLLAPGYLLARLLPRSERDDLFDLLGTCAALSAAVVPVALLLLAQTPLTLTGPGVRIGGGLLGVVALSLLVRDLNRGRWRSIAAVPAPVVLTMAGMTAVGLVLRAVHAHDLIGPLWIDAVHHSLLGRLIVERGAIPGDYLPYAQVSSATYHFGFQSMATLLHWLSGLPIPQALLLLGQALSGLAGLPLYALGKRWGKSRWAGLAAAAIPAALSLMPAYCVSWSRYTQIAGLFILPVGAVLLDRFLRKRRWHWGLAGVTAVTAAGLVVTHLRVAAFFAALAGLLLVSDTVRRRYRGRSMAVPWARSLAVAGGAVALIWPWLWPSIRKLWLPAAQLWPAKVDSLSLYFAHYGPGRYVAPIAVAGLVLALLRRRREAVLLLLWVGALVLMANLHLTGLLPGGTLDRLIPWFHGLHIGAIVDNFSVDISLYVPVSLGVALACGELISLSRRFGRRLPRGLGWAGAALLVGVSLWGAHDLRAIVNSRTNLLSQADLKAMAWIEAETTPDALFLINSYEWTPGVQGGTDGGYWISPLTGRRTWPPPALYGFGEPAYIEEVGQVARQAMESPGGQDLHTLLRQYRFTHIYLGRYGGPLTPEKLADTTLFRPLYEDSGVWVFAVEPP